MTELTLPRKRGRRQTALTVVACLALAMLAACGDSKDKGGTQTAAKVNKEEITVHQVNFVLQQQRGLRPDQAAAASKQALERLIDQEVALQKASELKLDRDPRVVQQLEAAKREIIARAYIDKVAETAAKPTAEEVAKYYDEKPALFKERRIYNLQELSIDASPEQVATLQGKLAQAPNIAQFVDYLKVNDFKFTANQAVRAAEQLPLTSLDGFARMKEGQAVLSPSPTGAQVVVLVGARSQPVELDKARPAIEQFLVNERKRALVTKDIQNLREAAKIQYVGRFAEAAGPGASAAPPLVPSAVQPADSAPATSGGLDNSAIKKGLGLK